VNTRPGREVYIREGCYYCHTQQVRDPQNSSDLERGWGMRRSVARDYIYENPPLLGSVRIGPDLANIGSKIGAMSRWEILVVRRSATANGISCTFTIRE
jgi:cytochrome c oxidase cbb3-type subunit 2